MQKKRGLLCFCATKSYRSQHIRIDVWFFMREAKSSALDLYFCQRKPYGKRSWRGLVQKAKNILNILRANVCQTDFYCVQ